MTKFLPLALITLTSVSLSELDAYQSSTDTHGRCANPAAAAAAADTLAAKFDHHQFIFIGSTHGDAKIEEFLSCLVSRPSFYQRATDIVTEWASSGQQKLLDRVVLRLEAVAMNDLAPIWLDTDSPNMWSTLPPIRQTIATLREVNKKLPPTKRIRLVGGNEGINWARVQAPEDLAPYPYKTNFMPHLIIEHLAKAPGNRTLVVYGEAHIRYNGRNFMPDIEAALGRAKLFVVGTVRELSAADKPYLAAIGDPGKPFFADARRFPTTIPWPDSLRTSVEERSPRAADYIDGLLYLGPEPDRNLTDAIPISPAQQRELARRGSILSDHQRSMRARFKGRESWFRAHPDDVEPRRH